MNFIKRLIALPKRIADMEVTIARQNDEINNLMFAIETSSDVTVRFEKTTNGSRFGSPVKKFLRTERPYDRIIFPHNFGIDSDNSVERAHAQQLADKIKLSVNGSRFFEICSIRDVVEICQCGSPMMQRYMDILHRFHCQDMGSQNPALFAKLPEIYNYIFSNGATEVKWSD